MDFSWRESIDLSCDLLAKDYSLPGIGRMVELFSWMIPALAFISKYSFSLSLMS
jgi:hypothetical protein